MIQLARALTLLVASICLLAPARASQVIVVRRGWHIDVGFAVADLEWPLRAIASDLPSARYVLFGFGDMRYLMATHHGSSTLAAALWPGRGIMLVTGLKNTPQQDFSPEQRVELTLSAEDARTLQLWVWNSFSHAAGAATIYSPGPYDNSYYYQAVQRYSAVHTCNTWAADALGAAHFKVHSKGVLFAGQLWSQVRRLEKGQHAAPSLAPR